MLSFKSSYLYLRRPESWLGHVLDQIVWNKPDQNADPFFTGPGSVGQVTENL